MAQRHSQPSSNGYDQNQPLAIPQQQQVSDPDYINPALMGALDAYPLDYEDDVMGIVDLDTLDGILESLGPGHPVADFSFASNAPVMHGKNGGNPMGTSHHGHAANHPNVGSASHLQYSVPNSGTSSGHVPFNSHPSSLPPQSTGGYYTAVQNTAHVAEQSFQPVYHGGSYIDSATAPPLRPEWYGDEAYLPPDHAQAFQPTNGQLVQPTQPDRFHVEAEGDLAVYRAPSPEAEAQTQPQLDKTARGFAPPKPRLYQDAGDGGLLMATAEISPKMAFSKKRARDTDEDLEELESRAPAPEEHPDDTNHAYDADLFGPDPSSSLHVSGAWSKDEVAGLMRDQQPMGPPQVPQTRVVNGHKRARIGKSPQMLQNIPQDVPTQPLQAHVYQRTVQSDEADALRMYPEPGQGRLLSANRAQAQHAAANARTKWNFQSPQDDATIPRDDDGRAHFVRQLVGAFRDTSNAINKGLGPHQTRWGGITIGDVHYTPQQIETACWQLVSLAEALHIQGPRVLGILDEAKMHLIYKSRKQNFAKRIELMCYALALSKARCDMVLKGESLQTFVGTPMTTISQMQNMKKANDERRAVIGEAKKTISGHANAYPGSEHLNPTPLPTPDSPSTPHLSHPPIQTYHPLPQHPSPSPSPNTTTTLTTPSPNPNTTSNTAPNTAPNTTPNTAPNTTPIPQEIPHRRDLRHIVAHRVLAQQASVPQLPTRSTTHRKFKWW